MPQNFGASPTTASTSLSAPMGTPGNVLRQNAMMGSSQMTVNGAQQRTGTHRIDGAMLEGLPPEFVQAIFEIAELVDIDGDGTPDVAMVPLNATGQAAIGPGGNALMGGGGQPRFASPVPGRNW